MGSFLQSRRGRTRLVLAIGIVAGLLAALYYLYLRPSSSLTFDMFYLKAEASMTGPLRFVDEYGSYHYTPVVILFFYPYVWLFDLPTAILVHRVINILVAVGYGGLLAWFLGQSIDLDPIDRLMFVGFVAMNVYTVAIISLANVGIVLVACLGVGFVLLEIDEDAGAQCGHSRPSSKCSRHCGACTCSVSAGFAPPSWRSAPESLRRSSE